MSIELCFFLMASLKESKNCHIVIVPYPGRGHINPMFTLCNQLTSSSSCAHNNVSFTIILTEEWVSLIDPIDKPANVKFASIPNVLPLEHIRGGDNEGFLHAVYTKMEEPVERVFDTLECTPNVIVADCCAYTYCVLMMKNNIICYSMKVCNRWLKKE